MLSWLRCEVPGEAEISVGGWSPKLVLTPVFAGAGPCMLGTLCFVLTHAAERVWQRAGAVMVQKAAGRGCCTPRGPSIRFPNMTVREAVFLATGFLAEMICLSGCSISSSNCLAMLVGAAVLRGPYRALEWCETPPQGFPGLKAVRSPWGRRQYKPQMCCPHIAGLSLPAGIGEWQPA